MYVCLCKEITERQLRASIRQGVERSRFHYLLAKSHYTSTPRNAVRAERAQPD